MKRLAVRVGILALPFCLFYGFPFFVLLFSGEWLPLVVVTSAQSLGHSIQFGPAYSNPVNSYKLQSANQRKADVLALGTSRVMAFRDAFFIEPKRFYNAGGQYARYSEYATFVDKLEYSPHVVILGLEQWFFNEEYRREHSGNLTSISVADNRDFVGLVTRNWMRIHADYYGGKFSLEDVFRAHEKKRIGLRAIVEDAGFENDGSYSYGKVLEKTLEERLDPIVAKVEKRRHEFSGGRQISPHALKELEAVLELCKKRGIHVVGFFTPYPAVIWRLLVSRPSDYGYMRRTASQVKPLFDHYGFSFFDFSNAGELGASDDEIFDGLHCSETTYLRVFVLLARGDSVLRQYAADEERLNARLLHQTLRGHGRG